MPEPSISTNALTKKYGAVTALDRVDLEVEPGSVYGLVGPNGAGKTTLLRILAGLRSPSTGVVRVGTGSVAVVPDTPKFERWMTGREVVTLSRTLAGASVPESAIDAVLDGAGLAEAADRKSSGYSRGMLQRLGLAAAVVNRPDILLLDEPAAALDPAGRREVLDMVREFKGRGTVLFSSHILEDVEQVCDTVGILRRGEIMYQGPLDGLLGRYGQLTYLVNVREGAELVETALVGMEWVRSVDLQTAGVVRIAVNDRDAAEAQLVAVLATLAIPVVSVVPDLPSLEQVFLEVTQ